MARITPATSSSSRNRAVLAGEYREPDAAWAPVRLRSCAIRGTPVSNARYQPESRCSPLPSFAAARVRCDGLDHQDDLLLGEQIPHEQRPMMGNGLRREGAVRSPVPRSPRRSPDEHPWNRIFEKRRPWSSWPGPGSRTCVASWRSSTSRTSTSGSRVVSDRLRPAGRRPRPVRTEQGPANSSPRRARRPRRRGSMRISYPRGSPTESGGGHERSEPSIATAVPPLRPCEHGDDCRGCRRERRVLRRSLCCLDCRALGHERLEPACV